MKYLGRVNICGIYYRVEERTAEEDPNLNTAYAYIVHGLCLIVVGAGLSPSVFRNSLFHEIQHGIWEHSGLRKIKNDDVSELEETHIQVFTPHWIRAMLSLKKWKEK